MLDTTVLLSYISNIGTIRTDHSESLPDPLPPQPQKFTNKAVKEVMSGPKRTPGRVIFSNGSTFEVIDSDWVGLVLSSKVKRFIAIAVCIYAVVIMSPRSQNFAVVETVGAVNPLIFWSVTLFTYVAVLFFFAIFFSSVARHFATITVYTPVLHFVALMTTNIISAFMEYTFGNEYSFRLDAFISEVARDFLTVLLFDYMFVKFVAPTMFQLTPLDGTKSSASTSAPSFPRNPDTSSIDAGGSIGVKPSSPATSHKSTQTLDIEGRLFSIPGLISIEVEDHYLRIIDITGIHFVRGKLSATLEKLPKDAGVQVNRSTWVARTSVETMTNLEKGQVSIELKNGSVFQVSQSRKAMVRERAEIWGIPEL